MAQEANIWNPRTLLEANANSKRVYQQFIVSIENQSAFTLTDFAYLQNTGALRIYKQSVTDTSGSGAGLLSPAIVAETSGTSFALTVPSAIGDIIIAEGSVDITGPVDVLGTNLLQATYKGAWTLATGPALQGYTYTYKSANWMLMLDLPDITIIEPSLAAYTTWFNLALPSPESLNASFRNTNYLGFWADLDGPVASNKIVSYAGKYWKTTTTILDITISTPSLSNTDWTFVATYSSLATYRVLDEVIATNGETYICHTNTVAGTLPTDSRGFINKKYYGAYAYTVSQLAGGNPALVEFIKPGLNIATAEWLIYSDGRVFSKNGATGTFSDPLDFNPATGIDSGISGTLVGLKIGTAANLDATENNKDYSVGKVLKVGDGGWFGNMISYTLAETGLPVNSALLPTASMYLPEMNAGGGDFCLHLRFDALAGAFRISNDVYTNNFFLHSTDPANTALLSPPVRVFHSEDVASAAQLEAGTDNARIPTAATLADAGFGFASKNMHWQDVSASRVLNVGYTNTTKNSIGVAVQVVSTNSTSYNALSVNGILVSESQASGSGTYTYTFFAIVPPNVGYAMISSIGTLRRWSEFKL